MSPPPAAGGAAAVRIGKVKHLSLNVIPDPGCVPPRDYIQSATSSPDGDRSEERGGGGRDGGS